MQAVSRQRAREGHCPVNDRALASFAAIPARRRTRTLTSELSNASSTALKPPSERPSRFSLVCRGPPTTPPSTAQGRRMSGSIQMLAAEASGVAICPAAWSLLEPITEFNAVLGPRDDNPRLPPHLFSSAIQCTLSVLPT